MLSNTLLRHWTRSALCKRTPFAVKQEGCSTTERPSLYLRSTAATVLATFTSCRHPHTRHRSRLHRALLCAVASSAVPVAEAAPSVGACVDAALYIASASLWLAVVSLSLAAFNSVAVGCPLSVPFASASADLHFALVRACTLSPLSFSIFSTLYTIESRPLRASTASRCSLSSPHEPRHPSPSAPPLPCSGPTSS